MSSEQEETKLSPRDFLRKRRPERFSDTIRKEVGRFDRAVLEYQLSIINRKSMELAFESFAKQLCEKIICPNLLEQTGPVAGGDGKVDTQTYPVSKQLKTLWYVGQNDNSDEDRWAFAVSTQEKWKSKCTADVKKIAGTNRGYKKAFYVTNQYVKANQRSEIEDKLTEEYGIDVRILDASWILDVVFKNELEQLAIDSLSIGIDWRREVEVGKNDYAKSKRLQELEKIVAEDIDPQNITPQQTDIFLELAVLYKELERPELETRGQFDRAITIAKKFGTQHQVFAAHYQYAWAAYWWYADMDTFVGQLDEALSIAKNLGQSGCWGDVVTLLGLFSTFIRGEANDSEVTFERMRGETIESLEELTTMGDRPSNSLMARAYLEILKLHSIESRDDARGIFSALKIISEKGEVLVGFSFKELFELVSELDFAFYDLEEYEGLLDYFTDQDALRNGEMQKSLLLLRRGAKRLDSNEPYQSIKLIGKSLGGLYKKESKSDLYAALNLLSEAYRITGLYWASRANLLMAASLVTDEWWRHGDLIAAQVHAYIRLAKSEIQLGRVNFALVWWNLAAAVDSKIEDEVLTDNDFYGFDAFIAQAVLNSSLEELSLLGMVPDLLDKNQLYVSRGMLLYALGYEEVVVEEYELTLDQGHLDYLVMVRDLDLGAPIPKISMFEGKYVELRSTVMGCAISVSFPFKTPLVELAESILSVTEAFFSTGMVDGLMAIEPRIEIEVSADDDDEIAISHEIDSSASVLKIDVLCSSFTSSQLNVEGQALIQEWLHGFVLEVFAHVFRTLELETALDAMMGEDRAMQRSVSFGTCFVGLKNILGDEAIEEIKQLSANTEIKEYKLKRTESWDSGCPKVIEPQKVLGEYKAGEGEPPDGLVDPENIKHSGYKISSLINTRMWDRAGWNGTGYVCAPGYPPKLLLLYDNAVAGNDVFSELSVELGCDDPQNRLRVSIIRGVSAKNPAKYRVVIGENVDFEAGQVAQFVSRINTMEPQNDVNLVTFLEAYKKAGCYKIGFAVIKDGALQPAPNGSIYIRKSLINVLDAHEVGPNHLEVVAILSDDDPIIPEGIKDAPVLKAMKRKFRR
ncbi:hypothetical protein [Saccharophagus degradans]|uniref:Tetratricopeptide repeat protein n=1 Tax=Saccharophagus degradans TaxID=86304 RepID=A0AAW7XB72_9GAMM|nr:hypothetical protein [Saccharophagus degradans]MDO6424460.1 hypothetical protein [Saccharophagus degradans]MDO6608917.1 hypothetical protein [Saccharophagus degradans]